MTAALRSFLAGVIVVVIFLAGRSCGEQRLLQPETEVKKDTIPDTVYVDRPIEKIVLKEIQKPIGVKVPQKDTAYRSRVERGTIITGVRKNGKYLNIQRIQPSGVAFEDTYLIEPDAVFAINAEGNMEIDHRKTRRKRFWRRVKNTTLDVLKISGGVAAGILIAQ